MSNFEKKVVPYLTYLGLRPGEKLYEEKLMAEEGLKKTKNDLIHIGCPIPFDIEEFLEQLEGLAICFMVVICLSSAMTELLRKWKYTRIMFGL